jgi:hypothetical protein
MVRSAVNRTVISLPRDSQAKRDGRSYDNDEFVKRKAEEEETVKRKVRPGQV